MRATGLFSVFFQGEMKGMGMRSRQRGRTGQRDAQQLLPALVWRGVQPGESLLKGPCSRTGGAQKDRTKEINRFFSHTHTHTHPVWFFFLQQIKQREKTTLEEELCCLG